MEIFLHFYFSKNCNSREYFFKTILSKANNNLQLITMKANLIDYFESTQKVDTEEFCTCSIY